MGWEEVHLDRDQLRVSKEEMGAAPDRLRDSFRTRPMSEVIDTLSEIETVHRATHAVILDAVAEIDAREGWSADGCLSMVDWLCFRFGWSRGYSHELVETARAMADLPSLSDAYAAGELSWDKTKAVAAVASPDLDGELTEEAKTADLTRLETAARRARAVSREEAQARHRARFFAMRRSIKDGGVRLSGFLPDVDGETVMKAIERLAEDVPKDPDTDLYPSFDERCADALVDLASGHLAAEQEAFGERAMVVAHLDVSTGSEEVVAGELESGIPVAPSTISRLMCDAIFEPVIESGGRPMGVGDKSRSTPQRLRRHLMHRDFGCRFPGCKRIRLVQAHHMKHWPGGPTEPENLAMLCRFHHRKMHEGGWSTRGDPEGILEFVKPTGEVLVSPRMRVKPDIRQRLLGAVLPEGP